MLVEHIAYAYITIEFKAKGIPLMVKKISNDLIGYISVFCQHYFTSLANILGGHLY